MAIYTPLKWPVIDVKAVCDTQSVVSGPLELNGTMFNSTIPNQISFFNNEVIRTVSVFYESGLLLGNYNIIVSGFQNNAPVTDTITIPNGTTDNSLFYGTKAFDVITSVVANGIGGISISVGTGKTGYLPLLVVNTITTNINYSVSILFPVSGAGITYSLYQTLDQINGNFITFADQIAAGKLFPAFGLINQATSHLATSQNITNFLLLQVKDSTTPTTDTFDFVLLQQ